MKFKEPRLMDQLRECPKRLQSMAVSFDQHFRAVTGEEPTITRVFDTVAGESGVHPAKRAFDCRDEHAGKRITSDGEADVICSRMNAEYPRRDSRLTCIHHSFKGGPAHFHIQVEAIPLP